MLKVFLSVMSGIGIILQNNFLVQEGQLRGWRHHLPRRDQVRSEIRGCVLELEQVRHDCLLVHDDDVVGHRVRRLVFASDEET